MRIEKLLVNQGAHSIQKQYEDAEVIAISFLINVDGMTVPFQLPARVDAIEKLLLKSAKRLPQGTRDRIAAQARRTAWKTVQEWVEIQLSFIEMEQAEFVEVFLPYVYDMVANETFYHKIRDNGFKLLGEPTPTNHG